jgi:hypothetical protein
MVTTDASGLKRKRNQDGTFRYYWEARTDLVKRGYRPSSVRLHYPDTPDGDLQRSARCRMLWAEMLSWASHGGAYPQRGYDGSLGSLCRLFQTDEGSPYRRAKWNVQRLYDGTFKIILATVANRQVRNLIGPDFARWHEKWAEPTGEGRPRRLTRAGHCMTTVRRVISYGVTLGYDDCIRTDIILKKMRFEAARPRTSKMTFDQLGAIRAKAHEMNLGSVALATTLQFELALRQKDVIGEWLPCRRGGRHRPQVDPLGQRPDLV